MSLRWERRHGDLYLGFSITGQELAQVAHVFSATGDDLGWTGWLSLERRELASRYSTASEAMAVAEIAIGQAA